MSESKFKKLNVAILSDSCFLTTGYRNQAVSLSNFISERGHNVFYLAHTYVGQNLQPGIKLEDGRELKFNVIGQGREAYFKDVMSMYMKQYNIDVFIILLDTFMLYPWLAQIDLAPAKVVFWYPSDGGGGMPLGCDMILRKMDVSVAMAKFGQIQVKEMYGINSEHIPHGTYPAQYKPISAEQRHKLRLQWGLGDKFVIGVVARNQGRKMLDRAFKIMAYAKDQIPNAVLLCHFDPEDPASVFHVGAMIDRYQLQNRVIFTGTKYYRGFDDSKMNDVYNLMDVFLLPTSGEGFGIPIIEAMSCEVPCLVTDYTTTRELIIDTKAGLGIALSGTTDEENPAVHTTQNLDGTLTGSWNVERGICSISDGAKKLIKLHNDVKLREELGKNGRKAVLKTYDWNIVKEQWFELIERLGRKY